MLRQHEIFLEVSSVAQNQHLTDMTEGSPLRHLLTFMAPLLVGNLFQQFYNVVDSLVVGNFVGANALAAVGTCGSLSFLFFSLSAGLGNGIGILASQYFGARDDAKIRATIANSIWVLLVAGSIAGIIGAVFAPQLLRLLQVPETILPDSVTYLRVTSYGIVAIAFFNGVSALLRALGDSRSPLYFLVVSCIMNVVLDLTFVLKLGWGVYGVALATIVSQYFSSVVSMVYAYIKVSYFRLRREELRPNFYIIKRCLQLGIPMSLQSSFIAISVMVLQSVVNSFGETVMAAHTLLGRVEQIVQQPYMSLGTAITSFAGQNLGAGKLDRIKEAFKKSTLMVLVFSLLMIPVFYLFADNIAGLFVKETEVISIGAKALCIDALFYFALGMIYVPRSILNGVGDANFALINGFTEVVCRIIFANILTRIAFIGFWGIWLTGGLTWTVTALVCVHRYFKGKWRYKSLSGV